MIYLFINLLSLILFFNFTLFYLDDFKLSSNKYIKKLQLLSPLLFIILIIFYYDIISNLTAQHSVLFLDTPGNPNVNIGASIEIGKDAAADLSKGVSILGQNIGLAGSIGALSGSVAKVISKTPLPPIQKAGIVIAAGLAGAGIHIGASTIIRSNSNSNISGNISSSPIPRTFNAGENKLTGGYENSALNDLILGIDMINYACLLLIIILFTIILFKFALPSEIKLNLSNIIGPNLNNSLNYYLNKIIQLNKTTSKVYIFIILILLLISLSFNCYFTTELYNNLDKFVNLHMIYIANK